MKQFIIRLWHGWQELGRNIGDFQARLLLTVFYFTVFVPFGLITRLFLDPLQVRRGSVKSGLNPRQTLDTDLDAARRQF
jgi:hypothetical protein